MPALQGYRNWRKITPYVRNGNCGPTGTTGPAGAAGELL